MSQKRCPQCRSIGNEEAPRLLQLREGKLEQCGYTFIPTKVWTCACGYAEYERSTAQWESVPLKTC